MNWSAPVLIVIMLLAVGDWVTTGKRRFKIPVGLYNIEMKDGVDSKSLSSRSA